MINFDDLTKENRKKHNSNCHKFLVIHTEYQLLDALDLGKTNSLFNVISQHRDIDKTYFYAKNPYEVKCQFPINKRESTA